ncbi:MULTISPECIES: alpha/beta hydrolase [unclassified Mycobacterium]|uniref:alpha/beta fold hydrolase n=1 Tax=unclassified Mycobacterium TaxID=2642494 RepID=UPI0029C897EC|nr:MULTISPECIES: alpha/beta hydrolase [unclassified Mycobacterium]
MITEDRVCFDGVHTRRLSVAGDGPPIALLHGFADGVDTWRALLTEFDAAGRAAFAVDMPGFGRAEARAPGPIMPQLDAFIDAVIADTGPVILMGNSLGACVSVRAAARGSSNIHGAIAVDEPILASHFLMRLGRRRADPFRVLEHRLPIPKGLYPRTIRRVFARLLYANPAQADPRVLDRFTVQAPDQAHVRRLLGDARAVALETAGGYDSEHVRCPLLVIHGRKDRIIPVHASQRLHESVPASTLVVLPNSGHCPQLDDPSTLARHVLQFIDGGTK